MSEDSRSDPTRTPDEPTATKRPEIDISKLPALPPQGSRAWRGSRKSSRWRVVGCGCGVVILIAAMATAFLGLRQRVWSSFTKVRQGIERSILTEVGPEEKQRLRDNLDRFEAMVLESDDPFPAIGRFVRVGRKAMADFVVEPDEADELNRLLEQELAE
ncbi:MAG: hypothetical protein KAJ78_01055 [Acidobacteria bacterium]|nr:hypothetical protein [Acidobacteriota bacterium]